tara:strand:- start:5179 stop:5553 length:375 start_codon:yes stop_codon:yes gene_type:complete
MFNFKVVTPERTFIEGEASMVVLPGIEGDIGILPDHSNIITSIRPGFVNIESSENHEFFVEEGFIKFSENELLVVAVGIVEKEDISNELLNEKIEQLLSQIEEADEKNKSKLQNKIDCLKLLIN